MPKPNIKQVERPWFRLTLLLLCGIGFYLGRLIWSTDQLPGWLNSPSVAVFYPIAQSLSQIHAGTASTKLPLWHPLLGTGVPLWATWEGQNICGNPIQWLLVFLDWTARLRWLVTIELCLAAVAFWRFVVLLRMPAPLASLATILFAGNPWLVGQVWNGRYDVGLAAICVPWAMHAVVRRRRERSFSPVGQCFHAGLRLAPVAFTNGLAAWVVIVGAALWVASIWKSGLEADSKRGLFFSPKAILRWGRAILGTTALVGLLCAPSRFPSWELLANSVSIPFGLPNYDSHLSDLLEAFVPVVLMEHLSTGAEAGTSELHSLVPRKFAFPYYGLIFAGVAYGVVRLLVAARNSHLARSHLRNPRVKRWLQLIGRAAVLWATLIVFEHGLHRWQLGTLWGISIPALGFVVVLSALAIAIPQAVVVWTRSQRERGHWIALYASLAAAYLAVACAIWILPDTTWTNLVGGGHSKSTEVRIAFDSMPTSAEPPALGVESSKSDALFVCVRQAVLALLFVLCLVGTMKGETRRRLLWLIVVLTLVDLRMASAPLMGFTRIHTLPKSPNLDSSQENASSHQRVLVFGSPEQVLFPLFSGYAVLNPPLTKIPQDFGETAELCPALYISDKKRVSNETLKRLFASSGVRYAFVAPENTQFVPEWWGSLFHPCREVDRTQGWKCYKFQEPWPRTTVWHRIVGVNGGREGRLRILTQEWSGSEIYVDGLRQLEPSARDLLNSLARGPASTGSTRVLWDLGNDFLAECQTQIPGIIVVQDVTYPGWKCFVNGVPVSPLRTNGWMRSAFVKEGFSRVRFLFAPYSVRFGFYFGAVGLGILTFVSFRKRFTG